MVILTLAIEVFAVLFIVLLIKEPSFNIGHWDDKGIMISSLVGIMTTLSIATLSTSYLSIMKRRRQEDEEEEIEFYSRRLKRAIVPEESKQPQNNKSGNEETKKEIDALGRMMINLEDIKEFYTWSQKQAKASFILAVSMCISGFDFDGSSYSFASCIQIEFSDVNYSCCRRSYNGSNCGNCIDSIS